MRKFGFLAQAALLAACGGNESARSADVGSLDVQVMTAGLNEAAPADLATITVALDGPQDEVATLTRDATTGQFATTFEELLVGDYAVTATGLDAGGQTIYFATAQTVTVRKDQNAQVVIVMNQRDPDAHPVPAPSFQALSVTDVTPEQQTTVDITVTASNATKVWGRHAMSAQNPGLFSATEADKAALANGTATIQWTSPAVPGMAWFVIVVEDDAGNKAEMGVTVWVGPDRGFVTNVEFNFNLAPTASFVTRTINDRDAAYLYVWVTAADTSATVNYAWNVAGSGSTCAAAFHSGAASGTVATGAQSYFRIDVPNAARTAPSCVMTLTLDDGSASSVYAIDLQDRIVGPDAGHEGDYTLTDEFQG